MTIKKVCIFAGYFPLGQGGAEYQSFLLANALRTCSVEVFFLTFSDLKQTVISKDGYKIYNIEPNKHLQKIGRPFFLYYYKIKKILSMEKPDIVYRRMGAAIPGLLALLKKKLDFELIWACAHISDLNRFRIHDIGNILNNIDDLFRIYGIKNADKILVQTNDQKDLLLKNFHKESFLFPNLHPKPVENVVKGGPIVKVIWAANYKTWKQPELFIDLAEALQEYSDVRFIMIGRIGPFEIQKETSAKVKQLRCLEHKGELPMEEVNKILAGSDVFINTSLAEGFPNTFIQAWMRKVPVISLHVDPDDMIKNNNIGYHSRTFEQLVEDTKTLVVNKQVRKEMGERAQRFALETFSIDNIKRVIKLFE